MICAALNEHVASAKGDELRVIEEHIDFAFYTDDIVHGVCAM